MIHLHKLFLQVYAFDKLVKGTYKGPNDTYHRLQSRSNSGVSEVAEEISAMFKNLPDPNVQGILIGMIIG